ncbi:MAG TPA: 2-phospho-L-lactate transferase [Steroidobacter sp.]|uniref:2-phospho-L-lactate transferase n=1 Tax=Steroidobacter sp. TaxID=1978227 RepID=UPI002ED8DAF9
MSAVSRVLALSGGVGGAKLSLGLQRVLPPGALTVVANTGDDFEHLGLAISPDVDTTLYTLASLVNPQTGWGRDQESWNFMAEIERLGGETWFRLGDRDLALHVERTRRLRDGEPLDAIVRDFGWRLGVESRLLPMSNDQVRTVLETDAGVLAFQDYFVRRGCAPSVTAIRFEGAQRARAPAGILEALASGDFSAVVICPSNPFLSIDPILAIADWRDALRSAPVPVVAVSPIIAGGAVKGPTAKLMRELGLEVSSTTVAQHYRDLIDGFVIDVADVELSNRFDVPVHVAPTLMMSLRDKETLANEVLKFSHSISGAARTKVSS